MKMYSPYGPLYPAPVVNPIKVRLNRIIYLPTQTNGLFIKIIDVHS